MGRRTGGHVVMWKSGQENKRHVTGGRVDRRQIWRWTSGNVDRWTGRQEANRQVDIRICGQVDR